MSKDNNQCPDGVKELNIMGNMLGHMDTCNYHCLFVKKYLCLHWCIASFYIQMVFIYIDLDIGMCYRSLIEAAKAAIDVCMDQGSRIPPVVLYCYLWWSKAVTYHLWYWTATCDEDFQLKHPATHCIIWLKNLKDNPAHSLTTELDIINGPLNRSNKVIKDL